MLSQLRRDPIMGAIALVWGGVLALNAGVVTGLITTLAAGSGAHTPESPPYSVILAGLVWLSISFFLLIGKARERCRALDLALPIPARKLWLAHVTALILLGVIYLACTLGILWILFWAFKNSPIDFAPIKQALMGLIAPLLGSLILMVVLLQRASASCSKIPHTYKYTFYSILLWVSGFGLSFLLSQLSAPAVLLPIGLGLYLAWRTYQTLPPAFAWLPAEGDHKADSEVAVRDQGIPNPTGGDEWATEDRKGPVRGWQFRWFLIRLLCLNPVRTRYAAIFFIPYIFLWGVFMSGIFAAAYDLDLPQLAYSVLSGFLLLSYLPSQMPQIRFADILPISRREIAGFLLFPPMLSLIAGLGAGSLGATILERSRLQVQFQTEGTSYFPPYPEKAPMVRVPAQYGEISWDGNPPDVVSPWGESHPVWKYRLFPGSRIMVYSPFSTPAESSPRFIAFQISRALDTIYGANVSYQEILDRYLDVLPDRTVAFVHPERLLADYPQLRPRSVLPMAPVLLILIGIVHGIMASIYFRSWRARVSEARTKAVYVALAIAAVAVTAGQVGIMIAGWMRPDVGAAFIKILMFSKMHALPAGTLIAWILCALLLLACHMQLQRELDRVEVLPSRTGGSCL